MPLPFHDFKVPSPLAWLSGCPKSSPGCLVGLPSLKAVNSTVTPFLATTVHVRRINFWLRPLEVVHLSCLSLQLMASLGDGLLCCAALFPKGTLLHQNYHHFQGGAVILLRFTKHETHCVKLKTFLSLHF